MVQAKSTCLLDKAVPWWAFVWPSCPAVSIRLIKLSCGEYSFDQAVRQRVFVWPSCPADGIRLTKLSGGGHSFDQAIRRWAFVWLSCPAVSIRLTKLSSCVNSFEQAIYQKVQFGSTVLSENILFLIRLSVRKLSFEIPCLSESLRLASFPAWRRRRSALY